MYATQRGIRKEQVCVVVAIDWDRDVVPQNAPGSLLYTDWTTTRSSFTSWNGSKSVAIWNKAANSAIYVKASKQCNSWIFTSRLNCFQSHKNMGEFEWLLNVHL